jgi:hypothetical protein
MRRKAVVSLLSSALPVRTQWASKSESPGGMRRNLADYESATREQVSQASNSGNLDNSCEGTIRLD